MRPGTLFPLRAERHPGPGTRLNGIYEIDGLIATGGMGEVYHGRTIETDSRVAIKMIRADLAANETVLALFRKEASALHRLQHDAIVRYYVSTTDPVLRRPYLAMEFVEGESLLEVARRRPLSAEAVRVLGRRLAAGLHAAHQLGVIHRDVSPDNVILPGGDVGRAKIIDFGVARSAFGDATIIGSDFAGKANYVSPEGIGLFGGQVAARSDIYGLGLTLLMALRGAPIDMGGTYVEVVTKRQALPDLSWVDAGLRPMLAAMLQPRPEDRPADMAAVAAWDIPSARAAVPRPARRPGRLPLAAAAVLALAAAIGGGVLVVAQRPDPVETASAVPAAGPERDRADVAPVAPAPAAPAPPPPSAVASAPDAPALAAPAPPAPAPEAVPSASASPTADEGRPAAPVVARPVEARAIGTAPFRDCSACPEMIPVPAGTFTMGSNADPTERPLRRVTLGRFAMGRHPVTVDEWRACVRDGRCSYEPQGSGDTPVHNVSFDDAQQYVAWLSGVTGETYRLPSEAEWEFAARAGTRTRYWWGEAFRSDLADCRRCGPPQSSPSPVDRYGANPVGLLAITGSVSQWTADCWHPSFRGAPVDGSARTGGACRERVLRGGSWMTDADALRLASREFYDASVRYPGHGLRVARGI